MSFPAFNMFMREYRENPLGQRLGQRFFNLYCSGSWPELFYAPEENAKELIKQWLACHHYFEELPERALKS